jgi:mono/diheme cytochrome c family protein
LKTIELTFSVKEFQMQKFFKWSGIVLGSLVGLILLILLGFYVSANVRLNKTYSVQAEAITIPTDPESVERGRQWVTSGVCMYCHGSDLAGTAFLDDPMLGGIPAPNLTSGTGGAGGEFTDEDWVRAIRYGVNPEGRGLIIMPSGHFYYFGDRDLGDIIAYLKSVPPVDREWPEPEFSVLGKLLVGAGVTGNIIEAERIDFNAARPSVPADGVTTEYGDYLTRVSGCRMCHGEDLTGDPNPPDPEAPPVPGLAAGSEVAFWSEADFIQTIRTGVAPSDHVLSKSMPWKDFKNMTDDQLKAIWLYLDSLSGE